MSADNAAPNESAAPRSPVTLRLSAQDGTTENHEIREADPKKPIYVSVGRPGLRSEIWRIWANKPSSRKSDIYITARPIAGFQKWSLHESGDWRYQWIRPNLAREYGGTEGRILDRWPRGPELAGSVTKAISIYVRSEDVAPIFEEVRLPASVTWLPAPPPGFGIGIHIAIARPDEAEFSVDGACPFDGFRLANGSVVLAMAGMLPVTREKSEWLDSKIAEEVSRRGAALEEMTAPRMGLFGFDDDGNRFVHDLALPGPPLEDTEVGHEGGSDPVTA